MLSNKTKVSSETCLIIFLRHMAYPGRLNDLEGDLEQNSSNDFQGQDRIYYLVRISNVIVELNSVMKETKGIS